MKLPANIIVCFIALALCSCSTQNRFASSFGKRRYNKGYYWNRAGGVNAVVSSSNQHKADFISQADIKNEPTPQKRNVNAVTTYAVTPAKASKHKTVLEKAIITVLPAKFALPSDDKPAQAGGKKEAKGISGTLPYALFIGSLALNLIILVSAVSLPNLAYILAFFSVSLAIVAICLSVYVLVTKKSTHKGYALGILIAYTVALIILLLFKPVLPF